MNASAINNVSEESLFISADEDTPPPVEIPSDIASTLEADFPGRSIDYEDALDDQADIRESVEINALNADNYSSLALIKHLANHSFLRCSCDDDHIKPSSTTDDTQNRSNQSLAELTAAWNSAIPLEYQGTESLLNRSKGVQREETPLQDFSNINFEDLLATPRNHTRCPTQQLSIAKSDISNHPELRIERTFDVDSLMLQITSLEAIRTKISISYSPPYHSTLSHTTHYHQDIKNKWHTLTDFKNICFGNINQGVNIYIIFPNLLVKQGPHSTNALTEKEQKTWIEKILIPAVQNAVPHEICQRHPTTFQDSTSRNNMKGTNARRNGTQDIRHDIPYQYLKKLWKYIADNCSKHSTTDIEIKDDAFRDPIIHISQHGTKDHERHQSPATILRQRKRNLEEWLDLSFLDETNSYFDLGNENVPDMHGTPMTLLWKSGCAQNWTTQFECPSGGRKMQTSFYPWMHTRDAGGCEFELRPSNKWFAAGLAHAKTYNVVWDITSGFDKGPFSNQLFEFLGLDQKTLEDVLTRSKLEGLERRGVSIEAIVKMLRYTTNRLRISLESKVGKNFGIRGEERLRFNILDKVIEETSRE